jgi:signal transduction histidine kinase
MSELQLLLRDGGNRHALASVLADHHTLVVDDGVRDADLFIVDEPAFRTYRAPLERYQHDQQPVFCPVVLIRREWSSFTVDLPDPATATEPLLVDEALTAPVNKGTLRRAVANLLTRRQQTKRLQKRTAQLEELASTLRHELRNPLHILALSLDTARNTGDPEALERCQRAVDRMERMLEETLLVVERGDIELTLELVDVETVARECWDIVFDSDAELLVEAEACVSADQMRLRQLLENLFRNAVEHGSTSPQSSSTPGDAGSGASEPSVANAPEDVAEHGSTSPHSQAQEDAGSGASEPSVANAPEDAAERGGTDVTVTVGSLDGGLFIEDDGPGIPEADRDRVFEEGYSTCQAGSGLGLAVVKAVVDAHGWKVRVTSGRDGGARFEITGIETAPAEDSP